MKLLTGMRTAWMALHHYRRSQRMMRATREQIDRYHLKKLQELVRYAFDHVPFYREEYKKVGFEPNDLRTLDDFRHLPYLSKEQVRERHDELLSDEFSGIRTFNCQTSGSTGMPLQVSWDNYVDEVQFAMCYDIWHQAGYSLGDWQFQLKYHKGVYGIDRSKHQIWMNAYHNNPETRKFVYGMFREHPVRHILGHPTAVLHFIQGMDDRSLLSSLRGITTSGEPLTASLRQALESESGVRVFDWYNNQEHSLLGYEHRKYGYIFGEYLLYPEIIPFSPEQPLHGEIITTTLYARAMPFIRYNNRDDVEFGKPSANDPCSMWRIRSICGRSTDVIRLPDGSVRQLLGLGCLGTQFHNVLMWQIEQVSPERIILYVVPVDPAQPTSSESMRSSLQEYLGAQVRVETEQVQELKQTPAGKVNKLVVSHVR